MFWLYKLKGNTNLIQYIELETVSIKLIKHQVIPLQKSLKRSKLVCSFNDGFKIPLNNASRFFLIWLLHGALHNMDQSSKSFICFFTCCAGSHLCVGLLCFDQCVAVFLMVSPTWSSPHWHLPYYILHAGYKFLSNKTRTQFSCIPANS